MPATFDYIGPDYDDPEGGEKWGDVHVVDMGRTPHKLIRHGVKDKLWGECSCGMWCWLGTYHMPKGRLATLRGEHEKHLGIIARADTCPDCGFTFQTCQERGGTKQQCYRWNDGNI